MVGHPQTNRRMLRVLHVDDHSVNRRLVRDILVSFGHAPVEVCSGALALQELGRRPFELVLMDINMPGMSGIEAVRRLRALPGVERDTPVVALTSEVSRSLADYIALGFTGYVAKPFKIARLMQAIHECAVPAGRRTLPRVA